MEEDWRDGQAWMWPDAVGHDRSRGGSMGSQGVWVLGEGGLEHGKKEKSLVSKTDCPTSAFYPEPPHHPDPCSPIPQVKWETLCLKVKPTQKCKDESYTFVTQILECEQVAHVCLSAP